MEGGDVGEGAEGWGGEGGEAGAAYYCYGDWVWRGLLVIDRKLGVGGALPAYVVGRLSILAVVLGVRWETGRGLSMKKPLEKRNCWSLVSMHLFGAAKLGLYNSVKFDVKHYGRNPKVKILELKTTPVRD